MRFSHYLALLLILPVLALLGCGGGGSDSATGSGSMTFAIHFPPQNKDAGAKYLPSALNSVVIDVLQTTPPYAPKVAPVTINRSSTSADVRVTVSNVPIGATLLRARGYSALDGGGEVICTAQTTCTILLNQTISVSLTMGTIATSVTISGGSSVLVGGTLNLVGTATDVDNNVILDPDFHWTSDDVTVATISQTGVVTGHARGTVTITCLERTSGKSDTQVLEVNPAIEEVVVSPSSYTINKNLTFTLTATGMVGSTAQADVPFTFESGDTAIATVTKTASGTATVTGKAKGETDITVTQPYTTAQGTCHVTVTETGDVDVVID